MRIGKKILILLLIGVFLIALPVANARIKLRNGDHVFDAKRFADSVKVTAEFTAAKVASQGKLLLQQFINTGTDLFFFKNTILGFFFPETSSATTPVNPNVKWENTLVNRPWTPVEAIEDNTFEGRLLEENATLNKESAQALASTADRADTRNELQQQLLQETPEGILAVKQRSYSVKIATALDEVEAARNSGIKLINKVYSQELDFSRERLQGFKSRQFTKSGYDPFHPTEQDKIANPGNSENFGFIRVGQ
jgi:hypothetical protein